MRFAIVGPIYPYRGGIAHFNSHLVYHLQKAGHEVRVFSFKHQYPSWLYPGESDRDPSTTPLKTTADFLLDPFQPWTWFQCVHQIRLWKPDLVLIAWWTTYWWLVFYTLEIMLNQQNISTTLLIHNIFPHEFRWWDKFVSTLIFKQSDRFIVQSNSQRDLLEKLKPTAVVAQCPHPIYHLLFEKRIDKDKARRDLGLSPNQFTLLFFGIIRTYKGLQNLVYAMDILKQKNEPVTLLVVGEFWESIRDYQALIEKLDLSENIKLIPGYVPNEKLSQYFSAADLLTSPYIGGTQSGAAKLALGFGLPVLVTEIIADELLRSFVGKGVTISNGVEPQDLADSILIAKSKDSNWIDNSLIAEKSWITFVQAVQDLCLKI